MRGVRGALAAVLMLSAAASMPPASAGAQTVTVALSPTLADTVAAVANLTGSASTFYHTLAVSITGCGNGFGSACRVYMSASPASSSLVTNLRWGTTQAGCTNTVQSGTTPTTTNSAAAIFSKGESNTVPNGSTTIYLCSDATLSWTVAPQRFAPNFYFTVIRQ